MHIQCHVPPIRLVDSIIIVETAGECTPASFMFHGSMVNTCFLKGLNGGISFKSQVSIQHLHRNIRLQSSLVVSVDDTLSKSRDCRTFRILFLLLVFIELFTLVDCVGFLLSGYMGDSLERGAASRQRSELEAYDNNILVRMVPRKNKNAY
ncbi:hypothetical protein GG344DRAFT_63682 [Lentinula edodes]|nr:hypothetical protein GG344DRAFT_63682 [Lentinula edodes]